MQRYVWLVGLLALLAALPGSRGEAQPQPGKSAPVKSYSTHFQLDEDPISEGGKWINGAKEGVDWYNVITKNGVAYLNGVEVITATDKTYTTGNPGMGFNYGVGKTMPTLDSRPTRWTVITSEGRQQRLAFEDWGTA